jgi:hypothetical protein
MLARMTRLQAARVAFMIGRTMAQSKKTAGGFETAVRTAALGLPGVEEGVACEGTAVESRTFKIRKKAFLFVRRANVMLKLGASADEAAGLASKDARYRIGAGGWLTVTLGDRTAPPPLALMTRWIAESYRLYAVDGKVAGGKKRATKRT